MSNSTNMKQSLKGSKDETVLSTQQGSTSDSKAPLAPLPPVDIPLNLLMTEPHPVLIQLHTAYGGVPVPIAAEHFMACIELARSIERSCPAAPHSLSSVKTADLFDTTPRLNHASAAPRLSMTGPPRRIIPLSDPPSQAKRLNNHSSSSIPISPNRSKSTPSTPAESKVPPPPPKDHRFPSKFTSKTGACEAAARFMEQIYAASKKHPITPIAQPDLVAQLMKRNSELEGQLQELRTRVSTVEEDQDKHLERIIDVEDKMDDATDGIVDLKDRVESLGESQDDMQARLKTVPALEEKVATVEKGHSEHKSAFEKFQAKVGKARKETKLEIDHLTHDVDDLYRKFDADVAKKDEADEDSAELAETLAKLNVEFEEKMKDWIEWTESLHRRVSKLEACDEDDDWVDADV